MILSSIKNVLNTFSKDCKEMIEAHLSTKMIINTVRKEKEVINVQEEFKITVERSSLSNTLRVVVTIKEKVIIMPFVEEVIYTVMYDSLKLVIKGLIETGIIQVKSD